VLQKFSEYEYRAAPLGFLASMESTTCVVLLTVLPLLTQVHRTNHVYYRCKDLYKTLHYHYTYGNERNKADNN
jgi:fumarate reductase subunit D